MRTLIGILCVIGFALIEAHAFLHIEELRSEAPYVMESAYFSGIGSYADEKVYLVVDGIREGGNVKFVDMDGEPRALRLSSETDYESGLVLLEAYWRADSKTLEGEVLYEYRDLLLRKVVSLFGLLVFLAFFGKGLLGLACLRKEGGKSNA